MSAGMGPDPQAMAHPSVSSPELTKRLQNRVTLTIGVPSGVMGRSPDQNPKIREYSKACARDGGAEAKH
jgi:hypothetical protein